MHAIAGSTSTSRCVFAAKYTARRVRCRSLRRLELVAGRCISEIRHVFFDASSSRQFSSRPDNFSLLAPLAYTQRNGRFATSNTSPLLTLWLPNNTPASHQALQRQVKLSVIGATTAEKLEGTSRGVDADFLSFLPLFLSPSPVIAPLLFYPFPSLPFYSFPLKFSKGVWEAL